MPPPHDICFLWCTVSDPEVNILRSNMKAEKSYNQCTSLDGTCSYASNVSFKMRLIALGSALPPEAAKALPTKKPSSLVFPYAFQTITYFMLLCQVTIWVGWEKRSVLQLEHLHPCTLPTPWGFLQPPY